MASSLAAQNYRLLAQRLRDQAAIAYSPEIRGDLESMARHYDLRADGAELSLKQIPKPRLESRAREGR